ncbi:MAG: nucleoside/nucleotide kinase family protein [Granulosicoccaceae bacterium]
MNLSSLASRIIEQAGNSTRHIVAVAGPPAAGKTTLAARLSKEIANRGESCAAVPMDGFHLDNPILKAKGLFERKGAPETFDAFGFVNLISRLHDNAPSVYIPVFDRKQDLAIAGSALIEADCKYVLVEGNYLVLNSAPWNELARYWDTTIFVNPGLSILEERLLDRWLQHGLDFSDAINRARDNDIPNANYVLDNSVSKATDIVVNSSFDLKS